MIVKRKEKSSCPRSDSKTIKGEISWSLSTFSYLHSVRIDCINKCSLGPRLRGQCLVKSTVLHHSGAICVPRQPWHFSSFSLVLCGTNASSRSVCQGSHGIFRHFLWSFAELMRHRDLCAKAAMAFFVIFFGPLRS